MCTAMKVTVGVRRRNARGYINIRISRDILRKKEKCPSEMSVRCFTYHQDGKSAEDEEFQLRQSCVNRECRVIFLVYRANFLIHIRKFAIITFIYFDSLIYKCIKRILIINWCNWFWSGSERRKKKDYSHVSILIVYHGGCMYAHTRRRAGPCAVGGTHVAASRNSKESRNSGTSWNPTVTNSDTQDRHARVTRRIGALRDAASS